MQTSISSPRLTPSLTLCFGINPKPLCPVLPAWELIPLCVFVNLLISRVPVVAGGLCRFLVLTELSLKLDNPFPYLRDGDLLPRPWLRQAKVPVCSSPPQILPALLPSARAGDNDVSKILTPPCTSLSLLCLVHCVPTLATDYWESN